MYSNHRSSLAKWDCKKRALLILLTCSHFLLLILQLQANIRNQITQVTRTQLVVCADNFFPQQMVYIIIIMIMVDWDFLEFRFPKLLS